MARGHQQHLARTAALHRLGRELARRSRARCELCEHGGLALAAYEVPPLPEEPVIERCVFVCERCRAALAGGKLSDPDPWRRLEQPAWSQTPAIQVCAVRLLRRLSAEGVEWAHQLLEDLYLDPTVEAWIDDRRERIT